MNVVWLTFISPAAAAICYLLYAICYLLHTIGSAALCCDDGRSRQLLLADSGLFPCIIVQYKRTDGSYCQGMKKIQFL